VKRVPIRRNITDKFKTRFNNDHGQSGKLLLVILHWHRILVTFAIDIAWVLKDNQEDSCLKYKHATSGISSHGFQPGSLRARSLAQIDLAISGGSTVLCKVSY